MRPHALVCPKDMENYKLGIDGFIMNIKEKNDNYLYKTSKIKHKIDDLALGCG